MKVGDKVRLAEELEVGKTYGKVAFFEDMAFDGIGEITHVNKLGSVIVDEGYYYSPSMLVLVETENCTYRNKENICWALKGECNPADKNCDYRKAEPPEVKQSDLDEKLSALIEETVSLNFPLKQGKLYHAETVSELLEKVVADYHPKSELLNELGNALRPDFYRTERSL